MILQNAVQVVLLAECATVGDRIASRHFARHSGYAVLAMPRRGGWCRRSATAKEVRRVGQPSAVARTASGVVMASALRATGPGASVGSPRRRQRVPGNQTE
jgi:hypothetical protein